MSRPRRVCKDCARIAHEWMSEHALTDYGDKLELYCSRDGRMTVSVEVALRESGGGVASASRASGEPTDESRS